MAGAFRGGPGEILSLAALIEEHPEAVQSDLIDRGVRLRWLGSDLLTWQDLWAIVACLRLPDSAILRAQMPKQWQWQLDGLLLADIADSLHWLVWAKSEDARRGRNRPRPIPRPGVRDHREHYGDAPMSIDAMNEFLGWEVV